MNEKPRPDVFLCYAKEDQALLNDFVERFSDHNKDKIGNFLYDKTPHSGNLHQRFKKFATTCHVALLLVNARFTCLDSYASKYEIPILSERQKAKEVCVVGVLFSDVNIPEWNEKGDVYFFQATNEEMPRTRRDDENGAVFNRKMANYEQIKTQDRSTFHRMLSEWVVEVVAQNPQIFQRQNESNVENDISTDSKENSSAQNQELLPGELTNSPFSSIEQNLRKMANHYFNQNGFDPPTNSKNLYIRSYLTLQGEKLRQIEVGLREIDPELHEFIVPVKSLSDDLTKRCRQIQELLEKSKCGHLPLNKSLRHTFLHLQVLDEALHKLILDAHTSQKKALKLECLLPLAEQTRSLRSQMEKFPDDMINPKLN